MVDLDEKNTDAFWYYNEIYAYEVLPESDFEPVSDQGKRMVRENMLESNEKGCQWLLWGLKCKCRWNEMRFKHYNCTITAVHENAEDPSKNTYDVLFDDSDTNEDVP